MIYSIGHDIVENQRIDKILKRFGERFIQRVLTFDEQQLYWKRKDKVNFIAKRFAAKEAFAKACGTGLIYPVIMSNIGVLNDHLGKPYFELSSILREYLVKISVQKYHLTLSDERNLSSAIVIFET